MVYVPESGDVVVHGGVSFGNPLGGVAETDTWLVKPSGAWELLAESHPSPLAAFGMA